MRVYISKFSLIFGATCTASFTAVNVFFIWLTYQLNANHSNISHEILLVFCLVATLFTFTTFALWWFFIRIYRFRNKPVISFDENNVSYWIKSHKELVTTQYDAIRRIDFDTEIFPKGSKFYLQIHKMDDRIDGIFMNNLGKSIKDIFLMFKEKCPHLTQSYSAVLLLA
ncbi:hypothetical protein [Glaciimonas soli]|uniref:Uncharacterized protein n=1 Tax=Glaciimonas soli TaxID=2590999 RepID=A0A843YME9_9BURK|nr:hypothetical protein [Glaciimonas soli]MQR00635.1 hypothetical protein [Glaciimonas soli]